jgi:YrbI family 3-deoxy-D-manno-octulosonate 8-phosphate phosphatase
MQCLVVIPARGGSRGVPRKNARLLAGQPLLAHAIAAARGARRIGRVVVSTDDAELAELALRFGAELVLRPRELSGDTASSESAVLHTLEVLETREDYRPELVMMVQCTSPLTTAEDLDQLIERLLESGADSAFTAVPFHHFLWSAEPDGRARGLNHTGEKRKRRQDMEPQYLESGAAYVMRSALFRAQGERFAGRVVMHVTDAARCLEIDEPADFERAELVLRRKRRDAQHALLPRPVRALVLDFDGVLTDNLVQVDEHGVESVRCDRSDGLGLGMLRARGIALLILSKEQNRVVSARAQKLGLPCRQGIDDKLTVLRHWLVEQQLELAHTVYIGNDVNDLPCLHAVGCAVVPSDAHHDVRAAAKIVLTRAGGHGAVRELCDLISAAPGPRPT